MVEEEDHEVIFVKAVRRSAPSQTHAIIMKPEPHHLAAAETCSSQAGARQLSLAEAGKAHADQKAMDVDKEQGSNPEGRKSGSARSRRLSDERLMGGLGAKRQ